MIEMAEKICGMGHNAWDCIPAEEVFAACASVAMQPPDPFSLIAMAAVHLTGAQLPPTPPAGEAVPKSEESPPGAAPSA